MRKSKITKLFDWETYVKTQAAFEQKPNDKNVIKKANEQAKALRVFEASVTKDIKLGLKVLQEALKKGEEAQIPYFLHLDYFSKSNEGSGSLLILGTQPALRKAFVVAGKTPEKVNLSYGIAQLDENNILRFVPEKNGMKVKPKPLVDSLKQAPISKSNPGFWSKRKVNNVIIGASEENAQLTGDSDLLAEEVTYTQEGINSEVYDRFKSFVNRDYINSNGTRNAEYYAQTLQQVDQWVLALQAEFKTKGEIKLKGAYTKMGKVLLAFKKKVQQEMEADKVQHIHEGSSLSNIEQVFERTLKEYEESKDAYQASILKGKLERILLELAQKINGDEEATAALALQTRLKERLSLVEVLSPTAIEPAAQQAITALLQEIEQLIQEYELVPLA